MTDVSRLLLLHLLSDRDGQLAGLIVRPRDFAPADLAAWLAASALPMLAKKIPCVVDADDVADSAEAYADIGVTGIAHDTLACVKANLTDAHPASVRWLAGHWYLQAPAKTINTQCASRTMALKLMQLVANEADNHEIENVFRQDPTLSYHLLRLVNSVAMGLSRKITSFSQAIILIGRQQLRRWLNFILFAARPDDPRSGMLLARVATRARLMELLAKADGMTKTEQDEAFMAGMFSMLGILFGKPLEEVLGPLKLSDALLDGLLNQHGPIGALLQLAQAYETGDIDGINTQLTALALDSDALSHAGIEAHVWMLDVVREGEGAGHG